MDRANYTLWLPTRTTCLCIGAGSGSIFLSGKNVRLNPELISKITLSNQCILDICGSTTIGNKTSSEGGDSMSSVLFADASKSWIVSATTLTQYAKMHRIDDCNFIKMDIEGGEVIVLPNISIIWLLINRLFICLYTQNSLLNRNHSMKKL
ncbi:MAG: FkbM family methyltransferase [Thaumarchaeota archaeon]|nr:FkbM family methyltransferase [Nitrososphaerota archaeon]